MKKKFELEVPEGADKVLLHTCCAPCSSAIIECMMQHHITPVIYYCNPNIYPLEEYMIRKDECTRYAQSLGLEIIDADYDHENWRCHIDNMPPLHTRMSHTGNRIGGKADLANDASPSLKSITSTTNNIAVVNSA